MEVRTKHTLADNRLVWRCNPLKVPTREAKMFTNRRRDHHLASGKHHGFANESSSETEKGLRAMNAQNSPKSDSSRRDVKTASYRLIKLLDYS